MKNVIPGKDAKPKPPCGAALASWVELLNSQAGGGRNYEVVENSVTQMRAHDNKAKILGPKSGGLKVAETRERDSDHGETREFSANECPELPITREDLRADGRTLRCVCEIVKFGGIGTPVIKLISPFGV